MSQEENERERVREGESLFAEQAASVVVVDDGSSSSGCQSRVVMLVCEEEGVIKNANAHSSLVIESRPSDAGGTTTSLSLSPAMDGERGRKGGEREGEAASYEGSRRRVE